MQTEPGRQVANGLIVHAARETCVEQTWERGQADAVKTLRVANKKRTSEIHGRLPELFPVREASLTVCKPVIFFD